MVIWGTKNSWALIAVGAFIGTHYKKSKLMLEIVGYLQVIFW